MMKKYLVVFFFIFFFSLVTAENCRYQTELNTDCNIMVKPLDSNSNECTSSCACNLNLWNPSYNKVIDNNSMNWDSTFKSFWLDTNALFDVSGEWIADVNCWALDINRFIIGQLMIVRADTNTFLHDINSTGAGLTANDVWTFGTRTLTDYNQSLLWTWLRPLYNDWWLTNAPRYCSFDDSDCIQGIPPDSNQRKYVEQLETPSLLSFLTENWVWGAIAVIFIFVLLVLLLKRG